MAVERRLSCFQEKRLGQRIFSIMSAVHHTHINEHVLHEELVCDVFAV